VSPCRPARSTPACNPAVNTTQPEPGPPATIHLVVIPRRPGDHWPLRGDYVEVVWAEILGPTATAIARRLGRAAADLEVEVPFEAIAASLAIPPGRAVDALRRLHHHGLIEYYPEPANVVLSGWAPSIPPRRAVTMSAYARHAYGHLEPDPTDPTALSKPHDAAATLEPSR
jgi:hypothetical protein